MIHLVVEGQLCVRPLVVRTFLGPPSPGGIYNYVRTSYTILYMERAKSAAREDPLLSSGGEEEEEGMGK